MDTKSKANELVYLVYLCVHKRTAIIHAAFFDKEKAEKFIEAAEDLYVKEIEVL